MQKFDFENEITDEEIERVIKILNKINSSEASSPKNYLCDYDKTQTVTRSFTIYKNVLDEFVSFCNKSKYTQYEILSRFILEGIEKYS